MKNTWKNYFVFLVRIKISQQRIRNPQGFDRCIFEVKRIWEFEGVIFVTKPMICSHSRARNERLITSDHAPLLIGSLQNECKIACPCHCKFSWRVFATTSFPDSASLRKDLKSTNESVYRCTVLDSRHGRKNSAYQKTTGTIGSLSCF